ncbi:MAG: cytochrome c peroxidase [Bacteroidota bacterium]|nr:cytochrome c peroxidase [Bacteroidota bacterium]
MKKYHFGIIIFLIVNVGFYSFISSNAEQAYLSRYTKNINEFGANQDDLLKLIAQSNIHSKSDLDNIKTQILGSRKKLKSIDFWIRYLEPLAYKKINGPLHVEWETEVYEKFEKPYKREGAGLTLAALYLDENEIIKDTLVRLIRSSITASQVYIQDSITNHLATHHHFYLCNRLFLLNLATIYTTGFENPEPEAIIPELLVLMKEVKSIYLDFNVSFPNESLSDQYLNLYDLSISYIEKQSNFDDFDHFTFIKDYVNPLFAINQSLILQHKVSSRSNVDYSLNKKSTSIFSKNLYRAQNAKGIYYRVEDPKVINEIDKIGKLLFYDPILSANNQRSCASCHNPKQYFTDNTGATALHFDKVSKLPRNTPSLINVGFNHLIMLDGKHISLQNQAKEVIINPDEMGSPEKEMLKKVLSCFEYKKTFEQLLKYTPTEKEIVYDHIVSAITLYYIKFSNFNAPFDEAINEGKPLDESAKIGFNIFMGKAQCATCHFAPQFNGVKPPYVGSEFEVLGVPSDTTYNQLSNDKGRYKVNPAKETMKAFRTGTLRNIEHTQPYMHNGVFTTLDQVLAFYDNGGGLGHGLDIENQTLSSDSLKLTETEKKHLISFLKSLSEKVAFEVAPGKLPISKNKTLNNRKVGGEY